MTKDELADRFKKFALRAMRLVDHLPRSIQGKVIGGQLTRSATSAAANYRAACRARSKREFVAKLGVVLEEVDESAFWFELIVDGKLMQKGLVAGLEKEADELAAVIFASRRTLQSKMD